MHTTNPIQELHRLGQSIWYDNIERKLLLDGTLLGLIKAGTIRGITSNPSIFNQAISNSDAYDQDLIPLARQGLSKEAIYEGLVVADIQAACDLFLPLYQESHRGDGYVSLEVSPYLADDTQGTLEDARRLWALVNRPNLMVKIPATIAGLPAITAAIADGININVTLIFAIDRYQQVMGAYLDGLDRRQQAGEDLSQVASVASFFVSRIDTNIDRRLDTIVDQEPGLADKARALHGRIAIASAKLAYVQYKEVFNQPRFQALKEHGARVQRPLWASTSTKNPAYADTRYVDELIGPETINTMPPKTLAAFRDHGMAALTLEKNVESSKKAMDQLGDLGISMDEVTTELEIDGVKAFADSYTDLLESIETRRIEVLDAGTP